MQIRKMEGDRVTDEQEMGRLRKQLLDERFQRDEEVRLIKQRCKAEEVATLFWVHSLIS